MVSHEALVVDHDGPLAVDHDGPLVAPRRTSRSTTKKKRKLYKPQQ
jgi:hypothetical protein